MAWQTYGPELEAAALAIQAECHNFFDIRGGVVMVRMEEALQNIEYQLANMAKANQVCGLPTVCPLVPHCGLTVCNQASLCEEADKFNFWLRLAFQPFSSGFFRFM